MSIRVLHLGSEYTWRGGENQARLLIEGLQGQVEAQFGATPKKSIAFTEKRWKCDLLGLNSGNPYDPVSIFQLAGYIKKNRINIIDAHTAKAHTLALNAAIFLKDIKIVVHRRVDNVPKKKYFTKKKYFHPKVTKFTAISNFIKQVLLDYGIEESKIAVARSAVSPETYKKLNRADCQKKLKETYKIPAHHTMIGNASALSSQKGHETLLRAIAELKKKTKDFTVLIAGDGTLKPSLEKLSQDLGITENLIFMGFIKTVPEFLSGLDILAVPSNNEGLGTVILDGILSGCAVVGSRVGGIPEIIVHNKTGLLEEVGDHQSLAENLADLIQNPDKTQVLRKNAYDWVIKEFSLQAMVEGNLKVYKNVLGM